MNFLNLIYNWLYVGLLATFDCKNSNLLGARSKGDGRQVVG